ncbi:MAG: aminofutalosine synthase MqnE [Oligoflexales bacterium]|nr:aminofutalosine synthase MqnE [Oligoflexales bacterium]
MTKSYKNEIARLLEDTVGKNQRLSDQDAIFLFEHADLLQLADYADRANVKRNSNVAFYNINRHINPTNVCAKSCKFCAFSRKPGDEGAFTLDIPEIVERAKHAVAQGATEVHMVGGLHPRWPFQYYLDMISAVKKEFPNLHIKAFTAVEIDWIAAKARKSIEETLIALKSAGLGSMPGGGAEIFHPEIRQQICDTKVDADRWIDIHRIAHKNGLRSNATMLYGHIENYMHRVDHMRRLRELQDETNSFNVFIPLAFQPFENEMGIDHYTYGVEDLRTLAMARLYLDNFPNIKSYWVMLGQEIAQLGLNFGANDIDGTIHDEKISRMAGGRSGAGMTIQSIKSLIRNSGKTPIQRDTLYRPLEEIPLANKAENTSTIYTRASYTDDNIFESRYEEAMELLQTRSVHQLGLISQKMRQIYNKESTKTLGYALSNRYFLQSYTSLEELYNHISLDSEKSIFKLSGVVFDLSDYSNSSENQIEISKWVQFIAEKMPKLPISIHGLKGLLTCFDLQYNTRSHFFRDLVEFCSELKKFGVRTLESSYYENESSLTQSEIYTIHNAAHKADLRTIAKLSLTSNNTDEAAPQWELFVKSLIEFDKIAGQEPGLGGVFISASSFDGAVTAVDYLKALAITSLIGRNLPQIISPIALVPNTRRGLEKYLIADQAPPKLSSLLSLFGATDFGFLPNLQEFTPLIKSLINEVKTSAFNLEHRSFDFEGKKIELNWENISSLTDLGAMNQTS